MLMFTTICSVIIAMSIYNFIEKIKLSIKNKTIDDDINRKIKEFNDSYFWTRMKDLKNKYNKK